MVNESTTCLDGFGEWQWWTFGFEKVPYDNRKMIIFEYDTID